VTVHTIVPLNRSNKPSREEAEAAFRTIIRCSGDDPDRPGLQQTPSRAARAFEEYLSGYHEDPIQILS
jgi:GTP cyclohydrolase IA